MKWKITIISVYPDDGNVFMQRCYTRHTHTPLCGEGAAMVWGLFGYYKRPLFSPRNLPAQLRQLLTTPKTVATHLRALRRCTHKSGSSGQLNYRPTLCLKPLLPPRNSIAS